MFLFIACGARAQIATDDFIRLTLQHENRIHGGAMFLYDSYAATFADLPRKVVAEYFDLHDAPKTMSLAKLREWGYKHDKTIAERIAIHFGKDIDQMTFAEKQDLMPAIKDLNDIEEKMKVRFLEKSKLGKAATRKLKSLEVAIDTTEVGARRFIELGIKRDPYHGAKFLKSLKGKVLGDHADDFAAMLAERLADSHYATWYERMDRSDRMFLKGLAKLGHLGANGMTAYGSLLARYPVLEFAVGIPLLLGVAVENHAKGAWNAGNALFDPPPGVTRDNAAVDAMVEALTMGSVSGFTGTRKIVHEGLIKLRPDLAPKARQQRSQTSR